MMIVLNLLRVNQWIKNLFIFAAIIFSLNLNNLDLLLLTIIGFLSFCLLSSAVYIFNDIQDAERDRNHPSKKYRPIAAEQISVKHAYLIALILLVSTFSISLFFLAPGFALIMLIYLVNNIIYTLYIKNIVILDVMSIALGFFLRVLSGAVIINVEASSWLLIFTGLLALFLGFGKRRNELVLLSDDAEIHRGVLADYDIQFIDQIISVVTAGLLLSYTLYTVADETVAHFGSKDLIMTVPFVLYGIFRYLYLIYHKLEGGDPTRLSYQDRPLLVTVVLWLLAVIWIIY